MLVEYGGNPRTALVDPSIGSSTASRALSAGPESCQRSAGSDLPDSSERTERPAACSTGRAAASATRSTAYCPGLVPAAPQSTHETVCSPTAAAAARSVCRTKSASTERPYPGPTSTLSPVGSPSVAAIDVAGYVADLKDHSVDHGFHVHDERHFVETYSLRQVWEVDLHPEEGCGAPRRIPFPPDLHLGPAPAPPRTRSPAAGHRPGRGGRDRPAPRGVGHRL